MYLLDTNIIIYSKNKSNQFVRDRIKAVQPERLHISIFTLAELLFGCEKSSDPQRNKKALLEFLLPFSITDFSQEDASVYGRIRSALEKSGTPIGTIDTFIASIAVSRGFILVTNNTKEFEKVPGIQIENWAESVPTRKTGLE